MGRCGVLAVLVCFMLTSYSSGQQLPPGVCGHLKNGYNVYYQCILKCYQLVFGFNMVSGDFCHSSALQIRGPAANTYSPQVVANSLKCISDKCRFTVPLMVCGGLPPVAQNSMNNSGSMTSNSSPSSTGAAASTAGTSGSSSVTTTSAAQTSTAAQTTTADQTTTSTQTTTNSPTSFGTTTGSPTSSGAASTSASPSPGTTTSMPSSTSSVSSNGQSFSTTPSPSSGTTKASTLASTDSNGSTSQTGNSTNANGDTTSSDEAKNSGLNNNDDDCDEDESIENNAPIDTPDDCDEDDQGSPSSFSNAFSSDIDSSGNDESSAPLSGATSGNDGSSAPSSGATSGNGASSDSGASDVASGNGGSNSFAEASANADANDDSSYYYYYYYYDDDTDTANDNSSTSSSNNSTGTQQTKTAVSASTDSTNFYPANQGNSENRYDNGNYDKVGPDASKAYAFSGSQAGPVSNNNQFSTNNQDYGQENNLQFQSVNNAPNYFQNGRNRLNFGQNNQPAPNIPYQNTQRLQFNSGGNNGNNFRWPLNFGVNGVNTQVNNNNVQGNVGPRTANNNVNLNRFASPPVQDGGNFGSGSADEYGNSQDNEFSNSGGLGSNTQTKKKSFGNFNPFRNFHFRK